MIDAWDTVLEDLRSVVEVGFDDGLPPRATLIAGTGTEPVALVGLRPFGPGRIADPLVELFALLLPLDVDRVALAVPGRTWSLDDPTAGEVDGADLRATVVAVTTVDAHGRGDDPDVGSHVWRYGRDEGGALGWLPSDLPDELGPMEGPVVDTLVALLTRGRDLRWDRDPQQPAVQLARCLLRGHEVVLAPAAAARVEATTVATAS